MSQWENDQSVKNHSTKDAIVSVRVKKIVLSVETYGYEKMDIIVYDRRSVRRFTVVRHLST